VPSPGNTVGELEAKLKEYFAFGAHLVWCVESELKTVRVFTAVDQNEDIFPTGTLPGSDVLPGFELPLAKLFEKAGPLVGE
jgi:Uma2 family endonuclease